MRTVQRQGRHVELVTEFAHPLERLDGRTIQHLFDQVAREAVVAGRYRGMRREDAARGNRAAT